MAQSYKKNRKYTKKMFENLHISKKNTTFAQNSL